MKSLSCVRLFATPWTVAYQAPLCMGFSSTRTRVGCHFLLQRVFLTQGSNLGLLHCRQMLYCLSHKGSPVYMHSSLYLAKSFKVCIIQILFSATSFFCSNPRHFLQVDNYQLIIAYKEHITSCQHTTNLSYLLSNMTFQLNWQLLCEVFHVSSLNKLLPSTKHLLGSSEIVVNRCGTCPLRDKWGNNYNRN